MIADPSSAPTGGRALVWFRKDLRLADNPCLEAALKSGKEIIAVYIWNKEEGGAWSPGSAARWWLHQALASLSKDIENDRFKNTMIYLGDFLDKVPKTELKRYLKELKIDEDTLENLLIVNCEFLSI